MSAMLLLIILPLVQSRNTALSPRVIVLKFLALSENQPLGSKAKYTGSNRTLFHVPSDEIPNLLALGLLIGTCVYPCVKATNHSSSCGSNDYYSTFCQSFTISALVPKPKANNSKPPRTKPQPTLPNPWVNISSQSAFDSSQFVTKVDLQREINL